MTSNLEPSSEFTDKIKQWIIYDHKLEELNKEMKNIRTHKIELEHIITHYMEKNNLQETTININNGQHLKYNEQIIHNQLSFKFLEECLNKYLQNKEETNNIIQFIKDNRIAKKEIFLKKK